MEIRGYFISDEKGHVAGIEYENRFPCGYVIDPTGEKQPIVFVIANAVRLDHDYHGEHCEVPDSAAIWADYATMLQADGTPFNPILFALYNGMEPPWQYASPYQKQIYELLDGTPEEFADLLSAFLSCHFLGRTAEEVKDRLVGWKFTDTFEGLEFDSFQACSLEKYGN